MKHTQKKLGLDDLLLRVSSYIIDEKEIQLITSAFWCAENLHCNQLRLSGEPYIQHPLNVTVILSEMHADANTISAALLHDTIEDCNITKEEISKKFNSEVAMLVDGVSKIKSMNFATKDEMIAANQRKVLTAINEDVRIIIIKLADRLHNMRTLAVQDEQKRKENALETIEIFVPIAYYLGKYKLKNELSDLAFKYLKSDIYRNLAKELKKHERESRESVKKMINNISLLLEQNNISYKIIFRVKNLYSVYKRTLSGKKVNEIHDLLAIKIIVDNVKDCYSTLGLVHSKYWPINNKFKDYIVNPKTNMYQSLHTTVFGEGDYVVQIQIKTHEMHNIANYGITALWQKYDKDANGKMQQELKEKFQFFKSLVELYHDANDDIEFINLAKDELFNMAIYVYTPRGEAIELPFGSTPIDFAYKLHTDIGNKMVGAMVNDNYVNLDTELKNKDRVKIITNDLSSGPSKEWLNMVKTHNAKRKIRDFLNN